MDIPALSMALAQNRLLNDVGVAVLSKSLDNMENAGEMITEGLDAVSELSVNPNIGANIDLRI
ncbi:YjfB family protein [Butyrivibrio proteoclasticus]|uniref:YjfB family protein n=1 Tax=Butyrivibrio proteoclasticus TaxID=43305 RepID=UPI00047B6E9F|nr:YjfB family protein [Butyrivibrio proteoclasticus]